MLNYLMYLISSSANGYFRPVLIIFLFFVVLYGGYYFSKKLKISGVKELKSGGLKVLQGLYLSSNQSLQLVKVYGKYFVLAVTKDRISVITEISEEDLSAYINDDGDFKNILTRFKNNEKNKVTFDKSDKKKF